jgi:hypothetical protein
VRLKEVFITFGACVALLLGVALLGKSELFTSKPSTVATEAHPADANLGAPIRSKEKEVVNTPATKSLLAATDDCLGAAGCSEINEVDAIRKISDLTFPDHKMDNETATNLYRLAEISAPLAMAAIDAMSKFGSDQQLEHFFDLKLSANAKAHLLDAALTRPDSDLPAKASSVLGETIRAGNAAEVLAALPKASHFSDATIEQIESLQKTLCRFSSDEANFALIKEKFNLVMKQSKPWQKLCKG